MKANRPISLITIALALGISAAVRLVWFNANQNQSEEADVKRLPPGAVSPDSLPFNSSLESAKVDLHNDGSIIIDGVSSSMDGLQAIFPKWIQERRVVSIYREPNAANDFSYTEAASNLISKAGLATQGRFEPQK